MKIELNLQEISDICFALRTVIGISDHSNNGENVESFRILLQDLIEVLDECDAETKDIPNEI